MMMMLLDSPDDDSKFILNPQQIFSLLLKIHPSKDMERDN